MNPRNLLSALLASAALAFGAAAHAAPTPITGGISLAGNGSPIGSANWFDSTGVSFANPWIVITANGSYVPGAVPFSTLVTLGTPLNWGSSSGPVSIPGGASWSFTDTSGDTYTLTGDFITNILRGSAGNDSISVTGTGTLMITGPVDRCAGMPCLATAGVWNYTAGFAGTQQNLSFSSGATAVPEPGTLALIGLALAAITLVRIRRQS